MKKIFLMLVLGAFLFAGLVYGGKYGEVVPFMDKMVKGLEKFVNDLEKAGSAAAVAAALDGYSDFMIKIGPKLKELSKKYPELDKEENTPEELKPFKEQMDKLTIKMAGLYAKINQYMKDPVVEKAFKRWNEVMKTFDDESENEDDKEEH
ncbi:MAG: hypothetical protein GTO45_27655 [Candidatus Aminicenantes bacterium]|nr:hypothetical protein [Candidatus Aminicenantes bacterium]NIM82572.1 hypothetical protein [Candidatus Aminicenantes bacterium]NIN21932.1 hypothetical protein [Candidatus Aminicenantes bacterium]NIN45710.1 hypothetical protein [Candidatus Aminicenantes bacterium]NIN88545.1 hypothetical protein [Candidatus Aminicenantes bacterium]